MRKVGDTGPPVKQPCGCLAGAAPGGPSWYRSWTTEPGGDVLTLRDAWERRATDWVRWARSPVLDNDFWDFHLPEFQRFVPAPGRLTVDVGCGEGRLGRALAASGHRVVGFDASPTSASAVAEVARVLTPDGRFCIALLHPALTARLVDGYAAERRYTFTVENGGLQMTYEGTHRPLATYFEALEAAGFVVESLREPVAVRATAHPTSASFTSEPAYSSPDRDWYR
jgi:SAM-dependent methyltransferase